MICASARRGARVCFTRSRGGAAYTRRLDVRTRLSSLLEIADREAKFLDAARDDRLSGVTEAMNTLRAELVAALAALSVIPDDQHGGR